MVLCLPKTGLFGGYAICAAMKENLMLFWLAKQKQITEGAIAHAINDNAERALKQVGIFTAHHEATGVVAKVVLPILQLSVAHKDMVVVVGFKEGGALL